jgi:hypothetical protein
MPRPPDHPHATIPAAERPTTTTTTTRLSNPVDETGRNTCANSANHDPKISRPDALNHPWIEPQFATSCIR